MSNIKVTVQDANNLLLEVTPVPIQQIAIDRGVAGRGVTDVTAVEIDNSLYLVFTFSDGTTETVGPVGTIQYIGQAPIVVTGSTISLSTVPVNLGGTGATTASGARTNLGLGTIATQNASSVAITGGTITGITDLAVADGGTGASNAADARTNFGLGTISTQNASSVSITGGTITGITDLAVADGGTGASTAAGAIENLLPSYTGNANKRLGLDGTATGLQWVTDGGGTVTSIDASGGTTGLSFTGGPITTSGTLTLSGTLDLDNGGTGATTAAGARTNLNAVDQATTLTAGTGLSGGGDLTTNRSFSITNTGVTAAAYGAASKTLTATVNAQGQLTVLADTPIAIANTQISGLGTMSTQNSNSVAITGGSITGITDLAVADGGTGASDAAGARTNLNAANQATTITAGTGLTGGGDLSANRTIDIANTTVTAGAFGSASNTLTATVNAQGQLTALAATPIAIANTQVSGLGTMSTQNSNAVTITGGSITGITDLAIADGGTGASNAPDARSNLGLGTAAVLNAGVALGVATLDAGGTVPLSQIPASIQGGVSYQGAWNASTNTPTLVSSVGSKGFYYVVSVAGNTNLNGVTDWLVGDWAIYNGTAWEKIDNTDQVASVNGYTGVVVLTNTDVGAPPTSLTISAGTGLSGGGNLTTNRTLSIANTTVTAAPYGTASAVPTFTVNGQGQLTAASDVTIAIANTQVSGLGTMSTQNANSVAITGGSITGITDLAIADGGTGASTAGGALTNLGAIGTITSADGSIVVTPSGTTVDLAVSAASPASTLLTQVRNTTGATLTKGTVVYISGATGQIATVSKAIATGDATSAQTLGMITTNLANNTNGYVTVFGLLENMDTSAYTDGAQLYLSGTVAGAVTATKPSAPIHLVYVAVVEYAHPTQGKLLVKVQNGYELDEIHDVSIVTPVTGQTLVYNSATDLWVNNTVSLTAGVNGTLPILNGGTGQTTANAAFNALAPSQTGNSGKYLTTDGTDTSWASNPLGTVTSVAATVPSFLSISGSPITTSGTLAFGLSGTALPTTSGGTGLTSFTSGGVVYASSTSALATGSALTFNGTDTLTVANLVGTRYGLYSEGAGVLFGGNATTNYLRFTVANAEQMRLTTTGLGIGTSSPAYKLDITGSGRVTTSFAVGGAPTGYGVLQAVSDDTNAAPRQLSIRGTTNGNKNLFLGFNTTSDFAAIQAIIDGTGYVALALQPSGGNVGIGTSSPSSPLSFGNTTGQKIRFYNNLTGYGIGVESSEFRFVTDSSAKFTWVNGTYSGGTTQMTLDSAGLLQVGTTSPAGGSQITAYGASNGQIAVQNSTNWSRILQNAGDLYIDNGVGGSAGNIIFRQSSSTSERARFDTSGNFLIATTTNTNTSKLVVNGTISQTVGGTQYLVVDQSDIGTGANEIPLNQYLGNLAYEDNTNLTSVGVGAGTAALPSIFNATDSDTGFWFPAANTIAASVNGAEQLRLNATGFGIGTNNPTAKLHVLGGNVLVSGLIYNESVINIGAVSGSGGTMSRVTLGDGTYTTGQLTGYGSVFGGGLNYAVTLSSNAVITQALGSSANYSASTFATKYTQVSGQHQWFTAASGTAGNTISFTQAMTLDASGQLGIGQTSPTSKLDLVGVLQWQSTAGTVLGKLTYSGGEPIVLANTGLGLNFYTNNAYAAKIDSSGNLLVGTTSFSFSNNGTRISPAGQIVNCTNGDNNIELAGTGGARIRFYTSAGGSGTTVGSISCTTVATLYNTTSDQRLKENIQDSDSASSLIDSLQVRQFDWKENNLHQRYGFVAQELVTVAPEAVHQPTDTEEMMAVDYSKLVPMLVKEVQSLRARVAQLEG